MSSHPPELPSEGRLPKKEGMRLHNLALTSQNVDLNAQPAYNADSMELDGQLYSHGSIREDRQPKSNTHRKRMKKMGKFNGITKRENIAKGKGKIAAQAENLHRQITAKASGSQERIFRRKQAQAAILAEDTARISDADRAAALAAEDFSVLDSAEVIEKRMRVNNPTKLATALEGWGIEDNVKASVISDVDFKNCSGSLYNFRHLTKPIIPISLDDGIVAKYGSEVCKKPVSTPTICLFILML